MSTAEEKIDESLGKFDDTLREISLFERRDELLSVIFTDYEDYRDGYMDAEDFLADNRKVIDDSMLREAPFLEIMKALGSNGRNEGIPFYLGTQQPQTSPDYLWSGKGAGAGKAVQVSPAQSIAPSLPQTWMTFTPDKDEDGYAVKQAFTDLEDEFPDVKCEYGEPIYFKTNT